MKYILFLSSVLLAAWCSRASAEVMTTLTDRTVDVNIYLEKARPFGVQNEHGGACGSIDFYFGSIYSGALNAGFPATRSHYAEGWFSADCVGDHWSTEDSDKWAEKANQWIAEHMENHYVHGQIHQTVTVTSYNNGRKVLAEKLTLIFPNSTIDQEFVWSSYQDF